MGKKIRFGIVGCGAIARWHVAAIDAAEGAELSAVMDVNAAFAKSCGEQYGVPSFCDLDTMLREGSIDAVSICTPSGLHAEAAIKALQAGKHVVLEKPMAITAESLEALLQAERESTGRLCPISQMRSRPDVQRAKKLIEDGVLGRLVLADLSMKYYRTPEYYQEKKWRGTRSMDGGGALMNQGIHGLDLMRYLCGEAEPVSTCAGALVHNIETEDTLAANLAFSHGGFGVITAATSAYPGFQRRLEICGTDGCMVFEEGQLTKLHTRSGLHEENAAEQQRNGSSDPANLDLEPHIMQYRNITQALLGGTDLQLTSEDAAKTVRLVLKIYEASV